MGEEVNYGACECCGGSASGSGGDCECCGATCSEHNTLFATVLCSGQSFSITQTGPGTCIWNGNSGVACGGTIGLTCVSNRFHIELQIDGAGCSGEVDLNCDESTCDPVYLVFDVPLDHFGSPCSCPATCRVIVTE